MIYGFEDFELDTTQRELRKQGEAIHIERQVFEVILLLVSHNRRVVPKNEILDEVWAGQFVSESALTSRIKSARRALGDDGRAQRLIKNIHGVGYRFVGEVEERTPERASKPEPAQILTAESEIPAAQQTVSAEGIRTDVALAISLDDEFPFVGRTREIERFWKLLSDVRGRSGVGLVGGEPGVGKSRLVVELAERAAAKLGALVAAGRCDERIATPLQPWRDVTHQLATLSGPDFERWSDGLPAIRALLLPPLDLSQLSGDGGGFDVQIATESLVSLVERISAERPIVIVIDDLHWSDEPTRMAMAIALRRLALRRVYFLASFRTSAGDMPENVAQWLADWERSPRVERIDIEGLSAEAVGELAGRVLGAERAGIAAEFHAQTAGHGLFVTELIREVERGASGEGLPLSIKAIVESRLSRLDENARRLVVAGAALGPEFAVKHAAPASDLEMASAVSALDRAIRAGLVHEGSSVERFRFSHQLMPEAVLTSLTSPARSALHHRCAQVLEEAQADAVDVAQHVLLSVPLTSTNEAVERARVVATEAHRRFHFDKAIRLLSGVRKLDLDDRTRSEVELELCGIMNDAGRASDAIEIFDLVVARAREHGWHDLIVRAAFGRGGHGPYRRLLDLGTLALLQEVDGFEDQTALTRARARARTAAFQLNWQRYAEREGTSSEAIATARREGVEGIELLQMLESRWIAVGCPRGADQLDAVDREIGALRRTLSVVGADAGMPETAALWFGRGDVFRHEAKHYLVPPGSRREIDSWRYDGLNASVCAFEGRFDDAANGYDEAGMRGSVCWGDSGPVLHGLAHLFLDAMTGQARSEPMTGDSARRFPTQILLACHAWSMILSGDEPGAVKAITSISLDSIPLFAEHLIGGNGLVALAETSIAIGHAALAEAARIELETVETLMLGLPWAPSFAAAHALARLAQVRGDSAEAATRFGQAKALYARFGAPALTAKLAQDLPDLAD